LNSWNVISRNIPNLFRILLKSPCLLPMTAWGWFSDPAQSAPGETRNSWNEKSYAKAFPFDKIVPGWQVFNKLYFTAGSLGKDRFCFPSYLGNFDEVRKLTRPLENRPLAELTEEK
jgi:hypothetical protein